MQLALGVVDGSLLGYQRPGGELVQRLVRQQVLVQKKGFRLRAQDAEVQHRHVAFSLDLVEKLPQLHADFYSR